MTEAAHLQKQQLEQVAHKPRTLNLDMFSAARTVARHYREGNLNWPMIIYIGLAHVAAVVGLATLHKCHSYTLLWAFLLWPITGFGITGGVHRLWSHRSYKATFALRVFLMLINSIANQGSIWHWARDHRVHHKHSETDADPHNATRGFFFAHMGWLFIKKHKDIIEAGKKLDYSDLAEDATVKVRLPPSLLSISLLPISFHLFPSASFAAIFVAFFLPRQSFRPDPPLLLLPQFQKALDPWFALFMCYVLPGLVCMTWGDDFW